MQTSKSGERKPTHPEILAFRESSFTSFSPTEKPSFEGFERQLRRKILKLEIAGDITPRGLVRKLNDDPLRIQNTVEKLVKEGFLKKKARDMPFGRYCCVLHSIPAVSRPLSSLCFISSSFSLPMSLNFAPVCAHTLERRIM